VNWEHSLAQVVSRSSRASIALQALHRVRQVSRWTGSRSGESERLRLPASI